MSFYKKKNLTIYLVLFFLIFLILFFYYTISKFQKENKLALRPISINLLTSVHPKLSWSFISKKSTIIVKPGEVTTIEYLVKNVGDQQTTGIATFAYYPKFFENYITKLNCFCYDAQTLKPNETDIYSLVLLVDPEVTKDSKTKNVKEVTIQFTFFDYKKYKENKS